MAFFNQGNGFVRKIIYVSEETMPPTHMPLMISGEWVVATHQDIRRTENMRQYSYCKIGPNGVLIPMQLTEQESNYVEQSISNLYQSLGQGQIGMPTCQLEAFLAGFKHAQSQEQFIGTGKNNTMENIPTQRKGSLDGLPTASCNQPKTEVMFINPSTIYFSDEDIEDVKNMDTSN